MSELRANTLSDAAGTGPAALTAQQAARARYRYDHTTPSITVSDNVSSITDNATGEAIPNWTNSFSECEVRQRPPTGGHVRRPRMSTLAVDNVKPSLGGTSVPLLEGLAKARYALLHTDFPGRKCISGNLAIPFSPSDLAAGWVYRFSVWHTMAIDDPLSPFPMEMVQVGGSRDGAP